MNNIEILKQILINEDIGVFSSHLSYWGNLNAYQKVDVFSSVVKDVDGHKLSELYKFTPLDTVKINNIFIENITKNALSIDTIEWFSTKISLQIDTVHWSKIAKHQTNDTIIFLLSHNTQNYQKYIYKVINCLIDNNQLDRIRYFLDIEKKRDNYPEQIIYYNVVAIQKTHEMLQKFLMKEIVYSAENEKHYQQLIQMKFILHDGYVMSIQPATIEKLKHLHTEIFCEKLKNSLAHNNIQKNEKIYKI